MPFGERSPPHTGVSDAVVGSTIIAQPRHGTIDLPSEPQKPMLSVTHMRPGEDRTGTERELVVVAADAPAGR